jgi:DNA-binding Lrp family transcriptional regulator
MLIDELFDYVKKHGPTVDRHLAKQLGLSLEEVRALIYQLQVDNKLYTCDIINFEDGVEMKGLLCRVSCFTPKASPGRKPGAKTK